MFEVVKYPRYDVDSQNKILMQAGPSMSLGGYLPKPAASLIQYLME